jgi:hypothetical protein
MVTNKEFEEVFNSLPTGSDIEAFYFRVFEKANLKSELKERGKFKKIAINQPSTTGKILTDDYECGEWELNSSNKALKVRIKDREPQTFYFQDFTEKERKKEILFEHGTKKYILLLSAKTSKALSDNTAGFSGKQNLSSNISLKSHEAPEAEVKKEEEIGVDEKKQDMKKREGLVRRKTDIDEFIAAKDKELNAAKLRNKELGLSYSEYRKSTEKEWNDRYSSLENFHETELFNLRNEMNLKEELYKNIIESYGKPEYEKLEEKKDLQKQIVDLQKSLEVMDSSLKSLQNEKASLTNQLVFSHHENNKLKTENQDLKTEILKLKPRTALVKKPIHRLGNTNVNPREKPEEKINPPKK